MKKLPIFIAASFGGISPNLLRLAVSLMKEEAELPGLTYALGLLIFALMGGIVAYIWEETDLKKAFYLGIGLPALIQMGAGEISKKPVAFNQPTPISEPFAAQQNSMQIIPAVFFQDSEHQKKQPVKREMKNLTLKMNKRQAVITVYIYGSSESSMKEERVRFKVRETEKTIEIPANAAAMQVQIGDVKSNKWSFPASNKLNCTVTIEENVWRGLFQAFGFRTSGVVEIKISGSK